VELSTGYPLNNGYLLLAGEGLRQRIHNLTEVVSFLDKWSEIMTFGRMSFWKDLAVGLFEERRLVRAQLNRSIFRSNPFGIKANTLPNHGDSS